MTTRTSAPVALVAGARYDVRMEYYEHGGLATARLLWTYPGQAQVVVPAVATLSAREPGADR